jgi:hypothetical protein
LFGGGSVRGVAIIPLVVKPLPEHQPHGGSKFADDGFRLLEEGMYSDPWRRGTLGMFGSVRDLRESSPLAHLRFVQTSPFSPPPPRPPADTERPLLAHSLPAQASVLRGGLRR